MVRDKERKLLEKARGYSFLLLKFRLRSEQELYQRLKKKKFSEEIIKETLTFLKERGFIDDRLFAKTWIESRLKRPLGLRRLKQELNLKGINKEIIEDRISEVKSWYQEQDVVRGLALAQFAKLKNIEPAKARRRIYGYLLRRGFSPEIIIDAINQL